MAYCRVCCDVVKLQMSGELSLSSLSHDFNQSVCMDHAFLDFAQIFRVMDATIHFYCIVLVDDFLLTGSAPSLETWWLQNFWLHVRLYGEHAFSKPKFSNFVHQLIIWFRPVPPHRNAKKVLESKHRITRSILVLLLEHTLSADQKLLSLWAITESNYLCGSKHFVLVWTCARSLAPSLSFY